MIKPEIRRCPWARTDIYVRYHDREWGVPVHNDRRLFEFLILEGAQAGLSWETLLKKRDAYRDAAQTIPPEAVNRRVELVRGNHSLRSDPGAIEQAIQSWLPEIIDRTSGSRSGG